jgi:hypothetical protein
MTPFFEWAAVASSEMHLFRLSVIGMAFAIEILPFAAKNMKIASIPNCFFCKSRYNLRFLLILLIFIDISLFM